MIVSMSHVGVASTSSNLTFILTASGRTAADVRQPANMTGRPAPAVWVAAATGREKGQLIEPSRHAPVTVISGDEMDHD